MIYINFYCRDIARDDIMIGTCHGWKSQALAFPKAYISYI